MKTPFTSEQFFEIFKEYNQAIFPLQILFGLLAFLSIYMVIKRIRKSNRIAILILSFFWMWMAIVYHLIYFSKINEAAFLFGILFIIQSVLFFVLGFVKRRIKFIYRFDAYGVASIVMIAYALVLYPVIGYFLNHIYPSSPTFGLPCPTTIFTFGLLLLSDSKSPISIFIIPFFWSILGFLAAVNFGVFEDIGLMIAGLITIFMIYQKRGMTQKHIYEAR